MKSLLFLTLAIVFGSCAMQNKSNSPEAKLISYESSGCFGKCPAEELTISKKLEMRYVGSKNVDKVGTYGSTISEEDYNKILSLFESVKFSNMDSAYLSDLKDIQKYTITLDGKTVSFHERNASEELKGLKIELGTIISKYDWAE